MASAQMRAHVAPPSALHPQTRPRASHPWIARYCIRLLELVPSMRVEAALQRAILAFPYCADLDPTDAADKYVVATRAERQAPAAQALRCRFDRLRG
jgi:hypothetical protein